MVDLTHYSTTPTLQSFLLPIRHWRHAAGNAGLGQLGFVDRADLPRLILVIHHCATFAFRDGGEIILADATLAAA